MAKTRKCVACGKRLSIDAFDILPGNDPKNLKRNIYCRQCQKLIESEQKCSYDEYLEQAETLGMEFDGFSQCILPDDLARYTDHQLLVELKRRGIVIEGKIYKTQILKTELEF